MTLRIVCKEVTLAGSAPVSAEWRTFDVQLDDVEKYLRDAPLLGRRGIVGAEVLNTLPQPEPIPLPEGVKVLLDVPEGVLVDENLFGFTLLHPGAAWYSPEMTPPGGANGGRMTFKWSRAFGSWSKIEKVIGTYDWSSLDAKAEYFSKNGLLWTCVLSPVAPPGAYGAPLRGPASTEAPYRNLLLALYSRYYGKGMRGHEISNEPETDNWYGSLGRKPGGVNWLKEVRQVARELSPWARVAKEAADTYFRASGNRVEIWGPGSQSMANADPVTGLARVFSDPSPEANAELGGPGFLNGSDGKGGTGAQWLDRFTFHGYPSPTHDGTLLHAHFLKAKNWLKGVGRESLPMVVTEHGVLTRRGQTAGLGDSSNGTIREWKTDDPYTGKQPPFTTQERVRWILNAFGISAIHGGRMIYYAWDEQYMGIYGWANGPQGGKADAPLGWLPEHAEIEAKYASLREKLVARKVFALWQRESDGMMMLLVGHVRETAEVVPLD